MEQLTPAKLDSMIAETTTELRYAQRALISPSRADAMERKASRLLSILLELKALRNKSPQNIILPQPACCLADHNYPAYSRAQVVAILESLGHKIIEEKN
ncbi:hypothetical protein F384_27645 (plasmid) [Citrobacter amalonaticus Y19]|uniref:Uncharacterized protein n=1 Tax=Citrobacter amalonaticus Y19 TaxID=1261127 RepID=A0A0F6U167_CITAM|nr:hypothetical protein [Citrobacter amalonaticus]AKE62311.1 hypothetical protein F384_27645 [Citrobacter amalonaticus Y19]